MIRLNRVLAPVDGSEPSKRAALYAAHLVTPFTATIYLLHAVEPLPMSLDPEEAEGIRAEVRAEAMALLEGYKALIERSGVRVECLVREGRPDYAILNAQEELDCDMIVMGARGLTGLEGLIMGSTAGGVIQDATCPVLVTRNLKDKYLLDTSWAEAD